ncbi:MAG: hypothetical protein IT379_36820 [Deltaproteobacteria bacterium]|nr:hypothetical protein [Deltaproteobacteria bacterium]
MKAVVPVAALAASLAVAACTDAVRDGQFACRTAGSTGECPPGLRCGLGSASPGELRCYATASVGLDARVDATGSVDSGTDAADPDMAHDGAAIDAGDDARARDAGPPVPQCTMASSCDAPCVLDGVLGEVVEIELETERTSADGPLALTCDRAAPAGDGPAQAVVALRLPAEGAQRILLGARHARTDVRDTLLEVRRDCTSVEDAECFDDIDGLDPSAQSEGTVFATGGETLYVVLTAAAGARPDTGRYRLSATVLDVDAPRIDELYAVARPWSDAELRLEIRFTFWDDDADLGQVELTFFDDDGPVDLDGDGRVDDADVLRVLTPVDGVIQGTLIPFDTTTPRLDVLGVTSVRAVGIDFEGHRGNPITAPLEYRVPDGATCAPPFECDDTFACESGTCVVSAATRAACASAELVTLATPTTTTTSTTRSGMVGGLGPNDFTSTECFGTDGPEDVYLVTVPDGGVYDLVARMDVPGTPEWLYSYVYVRRTCDDRSSELACNTDPDLGEYRGSAVVESAAPGTYAVIVERYASRTPSPSEPYTVLLGLRPVLPPGSPCDDTGEGNRCMLGSCAGGRCP